jgi:iron complex outermembrane receptor protein
MKKLVRGFYGLGALLAMQHTPYVFGQTTAPAAAESSQAIIVTGTRQQGLKAIDSAAPVQVLDSGSLERTGQPDLIQSIAQNIPSFQAQGFGGDTANLTLSIRLRGLSPNNTLVLLNGKRRHGTSNLAVLGGPFQGGASADLNFIPVAALERVEVLQDGAAAQYGTDAIAGVVNLIMKKASSGGSASLNAGKYFDGGGETGGASFNIGLSPADKSYINLSAEARSHGHSFRGDIDPRVIDPANIAAYPVLTSIPGYPYLNKIQGDAKYQLYLFALNSGFDLGGGTEFYTNATYGMKKAEAYENYRMPSRITGLYPAGFYPKEKIDETDYALTAGIKGTLSGDWRWDLSTTLGRDLAKVYTINSGNASLFADTGSSPTNFYDGRFVATQWTSNFDLNKSVDLGWAEPLNIALGAEMRQDKYEIGAGDAASRYKEGGQSFPGFALTDAGQHDRKNYAFYLDLASTPIAKLQLDAAVRYEHFSDFGNTTVGKLTGRYDFTPGFALRSTISSGFRAPTLAEEFYSATNVGPRTAFVQLPPNAPAAKLVGVDGLKPEKSNNYSIGAVFKPAPRTTITVDAYQIEISDRIVGSGTLFGTGGSTANSPAVRAAIVANGNILDPAVVQTGINIFSNAVSTRNQGLDFVATFGSDLGGIGKVDWTVAANFNKVQVTKINIAPAQLLPQTLLDQTAISDLETASPKWRLNLGALWRSGAWTVNLRETIFGTSSEWVQGDNGPYYQNTIGTKGITDLDVNYKFTKAFSVSVGANNLFNTYPDKLNPALVADWRSNGDNSAVQKYPSFSPFGINGGYYYAKANYNF